MLTAALQRREFLRDGLVVAATLLTGPALGADFLSGATVRVLVPSAAGSGVDFTSRLFVSHLARRLPDTQLAIENQPAANGRIAALDTWQAKADGLTITFPPSNLLFTEILGDEDLPFTLEGFAWIGSLSVDRRVLVVRGSSALAAAEDLLAADRPVLLGAESVNANHYREALLVNALTGSRLRPVTGYSSSERALALVKGEIEAAIASFESLATLVESGDARVLLRLNDCRLPAPSDASAWLGTLPAKADYAWVLQLIDAQSRIGRPIATTPGTPDERLAVWRDLFDAVTADADYLAEAAQGNFAADATPGRVVATHLKALAADRPAQREALMALLACGEARADGMGRC